ncbi:hypothetical protein FACS1894187_00820 [Synergistales bacterium]|nr:hypothetical protein FACS1894187_00820 [Synergistales bacterium]
MKNGVKSASHGGKHYELCLKEFKFAFTSTMAYILISCAICYITGYGRSGEDMAVFGGLPLWVLFGVVGPWILMVLLTVVYSIFIMKGDEE